MTITAEFNIEYRRKPPPREEIFNFRNCQGLNAFKNILDTENNLSRVFDTNEGINTQCNNWLVELEKMFPRAFEIIRVTNKVKETAASVLLKKRGEIKQKISLEPNNSVLKEELDAVTDDLTKLVAKDNCKKIMENFGHLDQTFGESFSGGMWSLKKKTFPKVSPPVPTAKIDAN